MCNQRVFIFFRVYVEELSGSVRFIYKLLYIYVLLIMPIYS